MTYLIVQTFLLLLLAALLGGLLGWYLTRLSVAGTHAGLVRRARDAEQALRALKGRLQAAEVATQELDAQRESLARELAARDAASTAPEPVPHAATRPDAPALVAEAPAQATAVDDDLQRIRGIGPKIAGTLADLGVRRYAQIAAWTPTDVERINARLRFKGRIEREQWIEQAQALLETSELPG